MKRLLNILTWLNPFNYLFLGVTGDCSLDDMETGSACLIELSDKEILAAEVWYMTQELTACGGTEFDIDTLQAAAACLKELSDKRLAAINAYSAFLSAVAAGASVVGTADEVQNAIKCFRELSQHELDAMKTLLLCELQACVVAPT